MLQALKNNKKKAMLMVASLILILSLAAGGTVAYLYSISDPMRNIFEAGNVNCDVIYANGQAGVRNTGSVEAYIRATLVVNWAFLDAEGNPTGELHAVAPKEGEDYEVEFATEGWILDAAAGVWYYSLPVAAGATTPELILSIRSLKAAPKGYQLISVVLASAIQCEPVEVIEEYWNVEVIETYDGTRILQVKENLSQ